MAELEPRYGRRVTSDELSKRGIKISELTPVQTPAAAQTSKLQKAANVLDVFFGGGAVGEAIGTGVAKSGLAGLVGGIDLRPEERQFVSPGPSAGQVAGSTLQSAALFTPVGRLSKGISSLVRGAGLVKGASAIGKIGAGALAGGAFDIASNLQRGETGISTLKPGLGTFLGTSIPAAGVGINILGRATSKFAPKLLSYTSDVPENAFKEMLKRRETVVPEITRGISPEEAFKTTQGAVRELRKTLSKEWEDGVFQVIKDNEGKRALIPEKVASKLSKVAEEFSLENLPQNIKSVSVKELTDLLKEVNELPKAILTLSPRGALVRSLKDELRSLGIETFGGQKGSLAKLYENYASKKQVFDAANDIVRAFSTGKPIQQSTAQGRLQSIFSQNKSAYFDAILDLEKITGKDLISKITAAQFKGSLPLGVASRTASGALTQSKSAIDKAIDLLIFPLSAPRSAAFIARALSDLRSPGLPKGISPGDRLLEGVSTAGLKTATDRLKATFEEFLRLPKGSKIQNAYQLVPSNSVVSKEVLPIIGAKNPKVSFTRLSLKHLAEKGKEGKRLLELSDDIIRTPDEVRRGGLENRFFFSKSLRSVKEGRPQVINLEVTEKDGNIVVTAFQSDTGYLTNYELLWRAADLPK